MDGFRDGAVHGWVRLQDDADRRGVVQLVVGGRVAGDAIAALPRHDLAEHGIGAGDYGFALRVSKDFIDTWQDDAFAAIIRLRDGAELPNGNLLLDAAMVSAVSPEAADCACWPPGPWRIDTGGLTGYVDSFGPGQIVGWVFCEAKPSAQTILDLWDGEMAAGSVTADKWRPDLAGAHQGDGRWGFCCDVPEPLGDGRIHDISLRTQDGRILARADVRMAPREPATSAPVRLLERRAAPRPAFRAAPETDMFSFIVNFYNMGREAARTLTSLTRAYQLDIGDLRYEVLCVDNGSDPPMDADWVRSFGPEFRLVRPARPLPSPCAAINEAMALASGRHVAVMIDGAHVLTPGVLREVWDALTEAPHSVVALRQFFIGGDQRWLAEVGYTTAQEDILFDRIAWPLDGYRMFEIGTPVWESPSHWLESMGESNCLFMSADLLRSIDGMDENFDEAGAGFANLDLFARAIEASGAPVVALIGEATFHQFHGGTTTNAIEALKERRVREYENRYVQLRGRVLGAISAMDIRFRGQLRTGHALRARHAPMSPANLGVTTRCRPGSVALHFDHGAQDYASSTYVECGLHQRTTWLGESLGMAPSDAMSIQDIIVRLRPGRIVAANASRGVIRFLQSVLRLADLPFCRIVAVSPQDHDDFSDATQIVAGDAGDGATLLAVQRALGAAEHVLVVYAPAPGEADTSATLRQYAGFVSPRSYLIFLGTAFGQPWLGYSKNWYQRAILALTADLPFAIDPTANPHLISTSPMGYLQRIDVPGLQDPAASYTAH